MGINHTFKITFPTENRTAVCRYLSDHASGAVTLCPELAMRQSGSIVIFVSPDRFIKRYFREFYHSPFEARHQRIQEMSKGGRCSIGCIDVMVYQSIPERFSIEFTCVSSDMSLLFNDSPSVRAWFVALCRTGQATFGQYTRDTYYYEIFWWENTERELRISLDAYDQPEVSLAILEDFYPLAFDSWYNVDDE